MKISNWTRRFRRALVAAGLCFPMAASAAELNTNLVVNGSFESVNSIDGPFTAVGIEGGWAEAGSDATADLFAYPYSSGYTAAAVAGAGEYYYTGGFGTAAGEVQVTQRIVVSGGAAAAAIASGSAVYNLSAFFSSYLGQDDSSSVLVRFLDSADQEVGQASIGGLAFVAGIPQLSSGRDWAQDSLEGAIPSATRAVEVAIVASDADTNHDGYVDLVNFSVVPEPTAAALAAAGTLSLVRRRR